MSNTVNGVQCPECGRVARSQKGDHCLESRPAPGGQRRRRQCPECGCLFTTYERTEAMELELFTKIVLLEQQVTSLQVQLFSACSTSLSREAQQKYYRTCHKKATKAIAQAEEESEALASMLSLD